MDILKNCGSLFENVQYIDCRHDARLLMIEDTCAADFTKMTEKLQQEGYVCHVTNKEGDVLFATFKKETEILNLSYTPCEKNIRLIQDTKSVLPPGKETLQAQSVAVPLVTQVRLSFFTYDCGMAYIIRLGDGRFFLIDGGMGEEGEVERMFAVLKEQNVLPGKPQIAGWFFSHAHGDHYNGFMKMMELYGDRIEVEMLIFDWLREDLSDNFSNNLGEFDALAASLQETKGVKILYCRTGQKLWYQNVVFDVLFTPEDMYPRKFQSVNSSSVVLRMTVFDGKEAQIDTSDPACGRRIMWMGDTEEQSSNYMYPKYLDTSWNSEIMQVGHHGYWGTTNELSAKINPEILLWPCPSYRLGDVTVWDCNEFINTSKNVKEIFCEGLEETVIDLTKPIERVCAFPPVEGDVIYHEDFSNAQNTYDLHWASIVGGQSGYIPVTLTIPERGSCRVTCGEKERKMVPPHRAKENRCGLEMVHPERMMNYDDYVLTLDGTVDHCGRLGLIWNDAFPTIWAEEKVWWLPVKEGTVSVKLTADSKNGKAQLVCDGEDLGEMDYVPADRHGIFLVIFDGDMIIKEVKVEKLKG